MFAYDGASPFDLNAAREHGVVAVTGYIVGHPGGFNPADKARVAAIRAAGLGFVPNWERAADFFATHAVVDARAAGAEARAACIALGVPTDGTVRVAFSFDFECPTGRFGEMGVKFDAVRIGLGAGLGAAIYGQYALINYLVAGQYTSGKHWLSGSTFNQPYDPTGANICMVQSHDAAGNWINSPVPGTDINTVIDPYALGAWWPAGSPYATEDGMLDANDPIVKEIRAELAAVAGAVTRLDTAHPGVPSVGDIWRMLNALVTDTTHTNTLPGVLKALAGVSDAVNAIKQALPLAGGLTLDQIAAGLTVAKRS